MPTEAEEKARSKFTFADYLSILGGVVLVGCLLSYMLTGTTTWGYEGRYLDTHYYRFVFSKAVHGPLEPLTLEELQLYNGTDSSLPIYVSVNGTAYDVSHSREIYGPGNRYNIFAGHDYSRLFVNGCFQDKLQRTYDLRGLSEEEIVQRLGQWVNYYEHNPFYWPVTTVVLPPLDESTAIPPNCTGLQFPGGGH